MWIIILIIVVILFFMYRNKQKKEEKKSLYDRLGGIYSIAAVVDYFSDRIVENPIAGKNSSNPALRDWYANQMTRMPGLKFMRTLWLASISGGPYTYTATVPGKCPFSLENAHAKLKISPQEFDAVAGELSNALDHFNVPAKEKNDVLAAFAGHKSEVDRGYMIANNQPVQPVKCPYS